MKRKQTLYPIIFVFNELRSYLDRITLLIIFHPHTAFNPIQGLHRTGISRLQYSTVPNKAAVDLLDPSLSC